jgi:hypothetical protein
VNVGGACLSGPKTSTVRAADLGAPATPAEVLEAARAVTAAADRAEAEKLTAAVQWALLHPATDLGDEAGFTTPGSDHVEPIAGEGCPSVSEFAIAEFGAVIGLSTVSAKHYLGQALELAHRLRHLWRRVHAGRVPAWKARRIAEATIHADLSPEAARFVDQQCAAHAHRLGTAAIDRLVDEAIARFHPERAEAERRRGEDARHVTIHDDQLYFAGTVRVEAELDLADGLDFRDAVSRGANLLEELGSEDSVDARRAKAVGDMARTQLSLDLAHGPRTGPAAPTDDTAATHDNDPRHREDSPVTTPADLPAAREVVLHVHLTAADNGTESFDPIAHVETGRHLTLVDQVKEWCADTHTRVTVRPVIDLNEHLRAPGYAIPDRLREQVILRDRTCVYPRCTRSARACDLDHIEPYDHAHPESGGQTATHNLAPLCRRHHRLKTHGRWRYTALAPGSYLWTSPHGYLFLRDREGGTTLLGRAPTAPADPDPPDQ